VAAARLELEHHLREIGSANLATLASLADVPVLAEDTPQVTEREEDRARALPAAKTILLAEMREG
jgi:hypothetical protein